MSLANFKVEVRLNELFSEYLQDNLSFSELKNMLIAKTKVEVIHEKIKKEIQLIGRQDIEEFNNKLETHAYEAQKKDDEQEGQNDLMLSQQDNARLLTLQFAIEPLRNLRINYVKELEALNTSSNVHEHTQTPVTHGHESTSHRDPHVHEHGQATQINTHVHEHPTPEQKDPHVHEHQSAKPNAEEELQRKIKGVVDEFIKIQKEISQIQIREGERRARESARNLRNTARVAYLSKTGSVRHTISHDRWQTLNGKVGNFGFLSRQIENETVYSASIKNHSILMEQLNSYLHRSKRSELEIHALRKIHTKMQAHVDLVKQASDANYTYLKSKSAFDDQNNHLIATKLRLQTLTELLRQNQQLELETSALKQQHDDYIAEINKLAKPGLILGGLSILFSIPLILTLAGIISYFMAPAVLLALFATPPALLLLVGSGVGITALVYGIKAYFINSTIQSNTKTCSENSLQETKNTQEAQLLETDTIPALEKLVLELKLQTDNLLGQKNQLEMSADKALKDAQAIEPVSVTAVSLFSTTDSAVVHQPSSQDTTDLGQTSVLHQDNADNRSALQ